MCMGDKKWFVKNKTEMETLVETMRIFSQGNLESKNK